MDSLAIVVQPQVTVGVAIQPAPAAALTVGVQGPAGPRGDKGDTGTPGPAGGTTYTFTQGTPSALWTIVHNLGKFPSVSVVDSAESIVQGAVTYINSNQLSIQFSAPFSGQAFLN